eukprot:3135795-Amphidinium_carterae.1
MVDGDTPVADRSVACWQGAGEFRRVNHWPSGPMGSAASCAHDRMKGASLEGVVSQTIGEPTQYMDEIMSAAVSGDAQLAGLLEPRLGSAPCHHEISHERGCVGGLRHTARVVAKMPVLTNAGIRVRGFLIGIVRCRSELIGQCVDSIGTEIGLNLDASFVLEVSLKLHELFERAGVPVHSDATSRADSRVKL